MVAPADFFIEGQLPPDYNTVPALNSITAAFSITVSGEDTLKDVDDTAPVLACVNPDGITNLSSRRLLVVQALGPDIIYGYSGSTQSFPLKKGQELVFAVGPDVSVFLRRSTTGTTQVAIAEFS